MKNKIMLSLFVLVIMGLSSLSAYGAGITDFPNLKISFVSQTPDPVEPGSIVELRWTVENIGSGGAEDVQIEFLPQYPFTLYSGEAIQDLGTINGRQTGAKGVVVLYKVRVDQDAVEGTNEVELRYKRNTQPWNVLEPFDINIQTIDATLAVTSVKVEPETIIPGKSGKITIELKNLADSLLKDVTTKLDLSSSTLPLAPLNSVTEKKIKMIRAGETVKQEYEVTSLATAESQIFKVPLELSFYDHLGNNYNKSDIIGVKVGDVPDLSYFLDSTDVYKAGSSGDVSVKFVNKGVTDVKFLNVVLKPTDDYKILSSEEEYLGNVDSDDYETADYKIYVQSGAPKELKLDMEITYSDANNNQYAMEIEPVLKLYDDKEAVMVGLTQKSNKVGTLITIVIVVVGIIAYRKWKKRKKK